MLKTGGLCFLIAVAFASIFFSIWLMMIPFHASKEREEMETRLFEMWEKGENK